MRTINTINALVCSIALLAPSLATAQEAVNNQNTGLFGLPITTNVLFGLGLTTTTLLPISITSDVFDAVLANTDHYIRENAVALQQDLQVGGGRTVDDLAQMFEVPPHRRAAFALGVRHRSAQLIPLTFNPKPDMERTRRFILLLGDAAHAPQAPVSMR
jgi:hypothetical protein